MAAGKRYRAAVIGGSGYGGAELIRRLLVHPEVTLARVASVDFVGEPLGTAHPSLEGATGLVFEDVGPGEAAEGMDVVLLALPHRVSSRKMPELVAAKAKVVDMSGDFRLKDAAAYERYYGQPHPHPELLREFVYGLPELFRERIRAARLVASPGCFATTIELALLPLGGGAVGGHAPPRAREQPAHLQAARAPAPPGDRRDARAGRGARARAALRAGLGAARARHPRDRLRRAARRLDGGARAAALRGDLRWGAVRARPAEAPPRGGRRLRLEPRRGGRRRGSAREGPPHRRALRRDGQPRQGWRRAGHPEHEPHARAAGEGVARGSGTVAAMMNVVVKVGGEVVASPEMDAIARDVRELVEAWHRVAIVHGGGPQASALQKRLGQEPRIIAGKRATDEATLEVMKYIVAGQVNVDCCARLLANGVMPVGLHG